MDQENSNQHDSMRVLHASRIVKTGTFTSENVEGVTAVCVVPMLVQDQFKVSFYFGGTSLLIIVSVALDTVQQIESHLITRDYEGLSREKGSRIRGRDAA